MYKLITFVWPDIRGHRTGTVQMLWEPGRTLKYYLHQQPLRNHGLIGMWKRCRTVNQDGKKVKLNYVPRAGDIFVMKRVIAGAA